MEVYSNHNNTNNINTEVEEGEACYYKDDDDNDIDPDIALSYIDEKIQNVLGHFQKDFEGGLTPEGLGAIYGGYGSFLPAYERSPSRWTHLRSPQRNHVAIRSPQVTSTEGPIQNLVASESAATSISTGARSCVGNALHRSNVLSRDVNVRQEATASAAPVSDFPSNNVNSNRSGNQTDQRSLKFRLRVGPDKNAPINAEIYSGLGLDNSPSTSSGSSSEEIGDSPLLSKNTIDVSPTRILQFMTSFLVPGASLISPLHESLLCLRNDRLPKLMDHEEEDSQSVGKSIPVRGNMEMSKLKKVKIKGRNHGIMGLKHENSFDNDDEVKIKVKPVKSEVLDRKDRLPTNYTEVPSLNTSNVGDLGKEAGKVNGVKEASGDIKTEPTHLMKESVLKPVFMQNGNIASQNSRRSSVSKPEENGALSSHPLKEIGKRKGEDYPLHSRGGSRISKVKDRDFEGAVMDSLEFGVGQDAAFLEKKEKHVPYQREKPLMEGMKTRDALTNGKAASLLGTDVELSKGSARVSKMMGEEDSDGQLMNPIGWGEPQYAALLEQKQSGMSQKEKTLMEGKKPKDIQSNGNSPTLLSAEKLKVTVSTKTKEKGISSRFKTKKRKKPEKHIGMGSPRDTSGRFSVDPAESKIDSFRVPSVHKHKEAKSADVESRQDMLSKESASGKRGINSLTSEMPGKEVPTAGFTMTTGITDTVPPAIDEWVACDLCQTWRLLPYGKKAAELPEKWTCSMLDWLPNMNRCDVTEEETTKALQAMCQIPIHDNQINVNGFDFSVTPAPGATPDLYQSTQASMKLKHAFKDTPNPCLNNALFQVSNSKKKMSDAAKHRSLNDMNQHLPHLHILKREGPQLSKQNTPAGRDMSEHKKENVNGANDSKLLKLKGKRKTDPFEFEDETPKRIKADKVNIATNYEISDDKPTKEGVGSGPPSSTKASEKHKRNGCHSSKEVKHESSSVLSKKYSDQAQFSADSASLDSRTCSKGSNPTKKRKLQDWMDDQSNGGYHHSAKDIVAFKEESGEHLSTVEKKPKESVTVGKYSSESNGNKRSKKDNEVSTKFLSAPGNHLANDIKKGSRAMDQPLSKHQRVFSPQHSLGHVDLLKGDAGHGQIPLAATSSSSKVSGSQQTGANYEEGRSSPVESVSSSPFRTSKLAKFSFKGDDICGSVGAVNSGFPLKSYARKGYDVKVNSSNNPSIAIRGEKVLHGSHSQSCKSATPDHQDGCNDYKSSHDATVDTRMHLANVNGDRPEKGDNLSGNRFGVHGSVKKRSRKKPLTGANSTQNHGNGSASLAKERGRNASPDFDKDRVKGTDLSSKKNVVYSSQGQKHLSIDNGNHIKSCEATVDVRDSSASKNERQHITAIGFVGHLSDDSRMVEQSKQKKQDLSNGRSGIQSGTIASLQHQSQDSMSGTKGDFLRSGKSRLSSLSEDGQTRGTPQNPVQAGLQNGVSNDPVDTSGGNDVTRKSLNYGGSKMNQDCNGSALCTAEDYEVRDNVPSSPLQKIASVQNASDVLKEAKRLRDDADRFKSSGFRFESNEECFNAALKFLLGASLLETCSGEGGRHGEMTPSQVYYIAARLCESCAVEFEGRQEMAAAALAYKCVEVAYMRVVYCKHSSLSRDRHELQATLQMVTQGDSPSSSASDVDNLNNQGVADKHILSKSTASHAVGNHVSIARNRPSVTRLLDFTKDVEFAMDASEKSHSSFSVANANMEEAQNKEHIVSVKKVIDFSFQDIEGLIRLVQLAREAIGRSGFSGARD